MNKKSLVSLKGGGFANYRGGILIWNMNSQPYGSTDHPDRTILLYIFLQFWKNDDYSFQLCVFQMRSTLSHKSKTAF